MFPELHVLERICTRSPGSLKALALIDPDDLATQPYWHLDPNIDALDFKSGKAAYALQDDRLTGRLEDNTTDNVAGDFFDYTLTARARLVRAEVELLRAKLRNRRVHVAATYYNGAQRLLPYMRIRARADSADRPAGRNGYTITGTLRLLKPAPFVGATIEVIGGPYVPPDPGSTGGVEPIILATSDSNYTYNVAAGKWLVGVEIRGDSPQTVSVGFTPGGDEFGGTMGLDALQAWTIEGNSIQSFTSTNIYFSGLDGNNTIKIWLLG